MSRDNRKKGCPNQHCEMNRKKHKFKASYMYCPICSDELVFVCAKCFSRIMNEGPNHKYCAICEAKQVKPMPIEAAQKAIKGLGVAGEKAGDTIKIATEVAGDKMKVAGEDIKKTLDDNQVKEAIMDAGAKVAKDIGAGAIRDAGKVAQKAIKKKIVK